MKKILSATLMTVAIALGTSAQTPAKECNADCGHKLRAELTALPSMDEVRAAFGELTPAQRQLVWNDKLAEVQTLGWNDAEKAPIAQLADAIAAHKDWFEDTYTDAMDTWTQQWIAEGRERFGWSDRTLYAIIATPFSMLSMDGAVSEPK